MEWLSNSARRALLSAAELQATQLPLVRWREGYSVDDVDAFLARAVQALEARERGLPAGLTADEALNVKFEATKFRRGYSQDAVDDLLDLLVATLR